MYENITSMSHGNIVIVTSLVDIPKANIKGDYEGQIITIIHNNSIKSYVAYGINPGEVLEIQLV